MFTLEWSQVLDFLSTPTAQSILLVAVLLVMMASSFYALRRLRDQINEAPSAASERLTNYREMHQRGDISDSEYRTIKSLLAEELQEELSNAGGADSDEEA